MFWGIFFLGILSNPPKILHKNKKMKKKKKSRLWKIHSNLYKFWSKTQVSFPGEYSDLIHVSTEHIFQLNETEVQWKILFAYYLPADLLTC